MENMEYPDFPSDVDIIAGAISVNSLSIFTDI